MLLYAWLGGHWEWLIVFCDSTVQHSDISQTCLTISEIIRNDPSTKRVIILTLCSVQQISNFVPLEHKFNFEQLSELSQEIVLDKKIDFQGCEVTMRSVLQRHGNVQHVLGPELVTDLITEGTAVNIGGTLQVNKDYYAVRLLERKVYLRLDILKDVDLLRHVFVVSGMRENDLSEFVPSGQTVQTISYSCKNGVLCDTSSDTDSPREVRFIRIEGNDLETCYSVLCMMHSEKTVHWVQFKYRNFLWIRSSGATDNLLNYVDYERTRLDPRVVTEYMKNPKGGINEEVIWKLNERTVLVVDEPGMGKSSTTTQVAWNTKLADPTSWVVRINWNDHTRKLQEINEATFNFDFFVDFLCSAAILESKYTDINRNLLKQALQYSGNVTVLMDGFDEISPTHADKAAVILSEMMKTKVSRVWVTSRPVEKERLENELSVTAFSLKGLSHDSQTEMLGTLWMSKGCIDKFELEEFLEIVNNSVNDQNFTSSPLNITMIATVYEKDWKTHLNPEVWLWRTIDSVNMYRAFVDRKLHIFLTEKQKADENNSSVLEAHEDLKQIYLKNFELCALVAILPPSVLKSLHKKKIEEKIKPFIARVQAGKNKTGIVMNVVDGKLQFVHRTFAEFFTARWFSRNFKYNRIVLEDILFNRTYWGIIDMFDRMLAEGFPLHCAFLEGNFKTVKTLLAEGCDLNAVDNGGRNLLHLTTTRDSTLLDEICHNFNYEAFLNNTDSVLQLTPLQYAIKCENWPFVVRLLESNVDRSGFDIIRQRAQEPDYINPIIIDAAMKGHLSLLEFLRSIGVNIHQASSTDFLSPLHAAMYEEQLSVIRLLIKYGADCNTRYSEGQTPLFDAVIISSLDVVRALVEEGGASLDIRDDNGRTVIDWFKECASDPRYPYAGLWKDREEELKDIFKYLQEMCKVSSSVW